MTGMLGVIIEKTFLKMQWHDILRKDVNFLCTLSCRIAWKPHKEVSLMSLHQSESLTFLSPVCLWFIPSSAPNDCAWDRKRQFGNKNWRQNMLILPDSMELHRVQICPGQSRWPTSKFGKGLDIVVLDSQLEGC